MVSKRIETSTSRTAEFTCLTRAASWFEPTGPFHSEDYLAQVMAPAFFRALLGVSCIRHLIMRRLMAKGIYEYVIARTKYIDAAVLHCLHEDVGQIAIFGAGFDTRALRFAGELSGARVFELDAAATQNAKIGRYKERGLAVPANLVFVPIDFDKESPVSRLEAAGFDARLRTLFILEGVLMYLQPASVDETFRAIRALCTPGSRVVFDYVFASVVRGEAMPEADAAIRRTVSKVNEHWHFGFEPGEAEAFLCGHGFGVVDHRDPAGLNRLYFTSASGHALGTVNHLHCLVTAQAV